MGGDRIVLDIRGERFAVDAHLVEYILDVDHFSLIPCPPQIIKGAISHRNNIIVIVNLAKLLSLEDIEEVPGRVVVIGAEAGLVGLYAGKACVSSIWGEECSEMAFLDGGYDFVVGTINPMKENIKLLDCNAIAAMAVKALSKKAPIP